MITTGKARELDLWLAAVEHKHGMDTFWGTSEESVLAKVREQFGTDEDGGLTGGCDVRTDLHKIEYAVSLDGDVILMGEEAQA